MKRETPAQKYRRATEECQLNAEKAARSVDREAWLRLAADWAKLAQSAELNRLLEARRRNPHEPGRTSRAAVAKLTQLRLSEVVPCGR
jgi:hypothetical protein